MPGRQAAAHLGRCPICSASAAVAASKVLVSGPWGVMQECRLAPPAGSGARRNNNKKQFDTLKQLRIRQPLSDQHGHGGADVLHADVAAPRAC